MKLLQKLKKSCMFFIILMIIMLIFTLGLQAEVNPDGSFGYNIDIKLPPGTKGVQPKLALSYNSNAKNGIVGMGWQLQGLPYIARDNSYPINYDGNDKYIGFGGRLVKVGNYYHYKEEAFSRFEAIGTQGDGPESWVERLPDGTKCYYGASEDSQVIALNHDDSIRVWALNAVEDIYGNYYEVEYEQDNGEFYPLRIIYTRGNGISRFRTLEFEYEDRSDKELSFAQSTKVETQKRLKWITIKTGVINIFNINLLGDLVRKYRLDYEEDGTPAVSKLIRVQEIGSDGTSMLQPVEFEWEENDSDMTFTTYGNPLSQGSLDGGDGIYFGDWNGDGKTDIMWYNSPTGDNYWYVNNGDMTFTTYGNPLSQGSLDGGDGIYFGDWNGDGKTDIMWYNSPTGDNYWYVNNGDMTFTTYGNPLSQGSLDGGDGIYFGDWNGDGKTDIMWYNSPTGDNYWYVNNGDMTFTTYGNPLSQGSLNGGDGIYFGDWNGDGKTDVMWYRKDTGDNYWYVNNGDMTFTTYGNPLSQGSLDGGDGIYFGDWNGDGKTDIMWYNAPTGDNYWYVNNGDMTFTTYGNPLSQGSLDGGDGIYFGDWNGDGKTDVMWYRKDTGDNYWYVNNGDMTFTTYGNPLSQGSLDGGDGIYFGDWNGDGKTDIMWYNSPTGDNYWYKNTSEFQNVITSFNNNIGSSTIVDYKQASQTPNAINPATSTYPYIVNKSPRNLVTKVTTSDGRGASYSTSYSYSNGKIYMGLPHERKNLLFESMTATDDQTGSNIITHYKQDDHRFSVPLKTEEYAGNGMLLKRVEYSYNSDPSTIYGTNLVRTESEITTKFENGTTLSVNTKLFQYDDYGNTTRITDSSTGMSGILSEMSYAIDEGNWILRRASEVKMTSDSSIIKWEKFTYIGNHLTSKKAYLDTESKWISVLFGYDDIGNVTSVTDPLGHAKSILYDSDYHSFPESVTNAKGHTVTSVFDARYGVKASSTDPNGNSTTYEYDEFGRLKKLIEPSDDWTKEIVYNDTGDASTQYIEARIADNSSTGYRYKRTYFDGLKREYKILQKAYHTDLNHLDQVVDIEFDSAGRVSRKSNPYLAGSYNETPHYTEYEYDYAGRKSRIDFPDSTSQIISYYSSGDGSYTESMIEKDGGVHKKVYNSRGKIIQKLEPGNLSLAYQYTPSGKLASAVNTDGLITSISYDSLGRKRSITDPSTGVATFSYDDAGRLISKKDAKNQVIGYSYDEINRIMVIDYPDGTPDVSYTYDNTAVSNGIGRITGISDGVSSTSLAYNEKGMLSVKTRQIDGKNFIFNMEYDSNKRLTSLTYPDGKIITREYNDLGLLKAVEWEGYPVVRYGMFKESEDGDIEDIDYKVYRITGNDIETAISYNPTNFRPERVISESHKESGSEVIEDVQFAFDNIGNITGITDSLDATKSQNIAYDALSRIISADGVYGHINYSYTNNGNLTQKGSLTLNYNSAHPYAVASDSNGNTYDYDANGNMISRKGKTLVHDAANRLIEVRDGGNLEVSYAYDYSGHRIKKTKSDGTVVYNINSLYELTQIPGRDDHHTKYFYGIKNELVAQATEANSTLMAFHTPLVIDSFYADNSLKGIILYGYEYLNFLSNNIKTYRYFIYAMLLALLILLAGNIIYDAFFREREEKRIFIPVWAKKAATLLLFMVISVFGFTGCEIGFFNSSDDTPWEYIFLIPGDDPEQGTPKASMIFFHPDYTGNIGYTTDSNGDKVCQIHYKPYGEIAQKTGEDNFRFKYNSHELDTETNLIYYKARYYDPALGRFITADSVIPDPMKTQAFNRYSYVIGNPITFRDASGHNWAKALMHHMAKMGRIIKRMLNKVYHDTRHHVNKIKHHINKIRGRNPNKAAKFFEDVGRYAISIVGSLVHIAIAVILFSNPIGLIWMAVSIPICIIGMVKIDWRSIFHGRISTAGVSDGYVSGRKQSVKFWSPGDKYVTGIKNRTLF